MALVRRSGGSRRHRGVSLAWINKESNFAGIVSVDNYTTYFRVFFIAIAARRLPRVGPVWSKTSSGTLASTTRLIIISTIGAIGMAAARELMTAYLSLELLSFSLYILVSFAKFDKRSNEAGLKYLLLGAFSSAMFLYGLSLIYGLAGSHVLQRHLHCLRQRDARLLVRPADGARARSSPASASRSRRCRSTCGRRTPTKARPSRSRRTSRRRRRRRASRCCSGCSAAPSRSCTMTGAG